MVASADRLYLDRLAHLGYLPVDDGRCATRWFESSPAVPRYYERFAASIEAMVMQSARLVPVPWERTLVEFLRRVEGTGLQWWLYGSGALAVRGATSAGDIDVTISAPRRARISVSDPRLAWCR